jgi:DNA-binding CsgD family transcriptional regulator
MRLSEAEYEAAVEAIEVAPFDGWTAPLEAFTRAGGGWGSQLILVGSKGELLLDVGTEDLKPHLQEFERLGGTDAHVNPRADVLRAPPGHIYGDYDVIDPDRLRRNSFYSDYLAPAGANFICMSQIEVAPQVRAVFATTRNGRQGHVDAEDREAFAALLQHGRRAIRLHYLVEESRIRSALGGLESLSAAAFALDPWDTVRDLTGPAAMLLESADWIALGRGKLMLADATANARLAAALQLTRSAPAAASAPRINRVLVRDAEGRLCASLEVAPFPRSRGSLGLASSLVILRTPKLAPDAVELLQVTFGLTPAEARIAVDLAAGASAPLIAQMRGATPETVRGQLKSIFRKLDVSSQSELIASLAVLRSSF